MTLLLTCAAPAGAAVDAVAVSTDRARIETTVGDRFVLTTTLTNAGDVDAGPLIAHLDVAGVTPDVYVDPEDWSAGRTQRIASLAPHGSVRLSWHMQAVDVGAFDAYVVLLPAAGDGPADALTVSRSVRLAVAGRRTPGAGAVLPVAVGVPALLAIVVLDRIRRRRAGRAS